MNEITQAQVNSLLADAMVERIEAIESHMLAMDQVEIPVESNNINGMYTRKIIIPKDTVLTGRVHLFDYVDIMLSGDITVATELGPQRYYGYNVFHGKAGRKRIGYAHEETHWITVHNTDISDGDDFYKLLTVASISDFNDIKDYELLLQEIGVNQEQVDNVVKNEADFIETSEVNVHIKKSDLHGVGLFASKKFKSGESICQALIGGMRNIAGRYSNHSLTPNGKMIFTPQENAILVALKDIEKEEEITTNYRDTLKSRGALCQQ